MGLIRKALGPKSKYERGLPYTFEARVDALSGQGSEPLFESYFSDTLCGLVELLDAMDIGPDRASIHGVFRGEQVELDNSVISDGQNGWLFRPQLCRALETYYLVTRDRRYAGHVELGHCSYEDRNRAGLGPY